MSPYTTGSASSSETAVECSQAQLLEQPVSATNVVKGSKKNKRYVFTHAFVFDCISFQPTSAPPSNLLLALVRLLQANSITSLVVHHQRSKSPSPRRPSDRRALRSIWTEDFRETVLTLLELRPPLLPTRRLRTSLLHPNHELSPVICSCMDSVSLIPDLSLLAWQAYLTWVPFSFPSFLGNWCFHHPVSTSFRTTPSSCGLAQGRRGRLRCPVSRI